jgi:hypothetical protein
VPLISQWKSVPRDSPDRKWAETTAPDARRPETAIWSAAVIGAVRPVPASRTTGRRVAEVAETSANSPSAMVTASTVCPKGIVSMVAPFVSSSRYAAPGSKTGPHPRPEATRLVERTLPT